MHSRSMSRFSNGEVTLKVLGHSYFVAAVSQQRLLPRYWQQPVEPVVVQYNCCNILHTSWWLLQQAGVLLGHLY